MQIMEMKIGNTLIRAHDDCFVKTEEEKQEILDNVGRIASSIYRDKEKKDEPADAGRYGQATRKGEYMRYL